MKKFLALSVLSFILISCGNGSSELDNPSNPGNIDSSNPNPENPTEPENLSENDKSILSFEKDKTLQNILVGQNIVLGGSPWYWNGSGMVEINSPCLTYPTTDSGRANSIIAPSGLENHWEFKTNQRLIDDGIPPQLYYCSEGLYDHLFYNPNEDGLVKYDSVASFFVYEDRIIFSGVYTKQWNGSNPYRDLLTAGASVYIFGIKKFQEHTGVRRKVRVKKTFLKDQSFRGLTVDCVKSEITEPLDTQGEGLNWGTNVARDDYATKTITVVCEEIGLQSIDFEANLTW